MNVEIDADTGPKPFQVILHAGHGSLEVRKWNQNAFSPNQTSNLIWQRRQVVELLKSEARHVLIRTIRIEHRIDVV